jgi:hypothetical protein
MMDGRNAKKNETMNRILGISITIAFAIVANAKAEEMITLAWQGESRTMPKGVFEAGQNFGLQVAQRAIQELQREKKVGALQALHVPSKEADFEAVAEGLITYAKTEYAKGEDAHSFAFVAYVTLVQETFRHAFSEAF